jgi:transposase InsO family protein
MTIPTEPHGVRGADITYASRLYCDVLAQFGLIGSISAPANPYNNAQAESFMKTLKVTIWRHQYLQPTSLVQNSDSD